MKTATPLMFQSFDSARGALDVDFEHLQAPQLVTAILAACAAGDADEADLWALPVGRRTECLLAVLALAGNEPLWAQTCCSVCSEPIEIDVTPTELVALAPANERVRVEAGGETFELRRPTGYDQLSWQRGAFADDDDAVRSVAAELIGAGAEIELDQALVAAVEQAFAKIDPLVCLQLEVRCPYCRELRPCQLDILDLLLRRFREQQDRLVDDVHVFASHYHWTETDVVALPEARRARYRALIDVGRS